MLQCNCNSVSHEAGLVTIEEWSWKSKLTDDELYNLFGLVRCLCPEARRGEAEAERDNEESLRRWRAAEVCRNTDKVDWQKEGF